MAIEYAPIVRCAECKHYAVTGYLDFEGNTIFGPAYCFCSILDTYTFCDFFCAHGERGEAG